MAPGATSKFGARMFETEVLRKQMYCIEDSTCDIVGTFWLPQPIGAAHSDLERPGNCSALPLVVTPLIATQALLQSRLLVFGELTMLSSDVDMT